MTRWVSGLLVLGVIAAGPFSLRAALESGSTPPQTTQSGGHSFDPSQLRDITGIEETGRPSSPTRWPRWLGAALVVLGGVGAAAWTKSRLSRRRPDPLPHLRALADLDRIEQMQLPARGEIDRFHALIADVVRRHLELCFRLQALRQTTAEFLEAFSRSAPLSPAQHNLLHHLLERCDLAKFARATFSPEECAEAISMARALVTQTEASQEIASRGA